MNGKVDATEQRPDLAEVLRSVWAQNAQSGAEQVYVGKVIFDPFAEPGYYSLAGDFGIHGPTRFDMNLILRGGATHEGSYTVELTRVSLLDGKQNVRITFSGDVIASGLQDQRQPLLRFDPEKKTLFGKRIPFLT